jgi:hypothetical protein
MTDTAVPVPDLEELSARFRTLAELECRGYSPLYETLALGTAGDPELLEMLAQARVGQRRPTLFLAAANLLGGIAADTDFATFRDFCLANREAMLAIIETRATQTNEVRRSAVLLPAFAAAAQGRPLALVEVGTSAGLNLMFDRYSYDYGGGRTLGSGTPLLPSDVDDEFVPTAIPEVVWRRGIDREPVDVRDEAAVAWLRACIWADQTDRIERFEQAVAAARLDPPPIVEGNALDVLTHTVAQAPADAHLVLFHTWVVAYFTRDERAQLFAQIDALGAARDLTWISAESPHIVTPLGLEPEARTVIGMSRYTSGHRATSVFAECHPHGAWLRRA